MSHAKRRRQEAERARQRRVFLTLGVLAAAFVGLVIALALREPAGPRLSDGASGAQVLPFTLPDQDGKQVSIKADGKPLVVELMATWCPYCAYEAKYDLSEIIPYVQGKGGRFVAINATNRLGIGTAGEKGQPGSGRDGSRATPTGDPDQAFQAEMKRYVQTYPAAGQAPFLYDPESTVASRFNLRGYPTFALVDGGGRVIAIKEGAVPAAEFRTWFDAAFPPSR